jgi:hypothetical protein
MVSGRLSAVDPLVELVESIRSLPYGRPSVRTVEGMLREGRGTRSTKHRFLFEQLRDRFPDTGPEIVHRVYTVQPQGIVDVHRYVLATVQGRRITLDVTFPSDEPWDGASPMPLACEPGEDHVAGPDPDAEKRALEDRFCDPAVREPYIASLAAKPLGGGPGAA